METTILLLCDDHVRQAWSNFITNFDNKVFLAGSSLVDKMRLLENEYNGTLILDGVQARLNFATSEDAIIFMIKWS